MSTPSSSVFVESVSELARVVRAAKLDHEAFTRLILPCDLGHCRATCCHDGAILSAEERREISSLLDKHPGAFPGLHADSVFEKNRRGATKTSVRRASADQIAEDFPNHFPRTRCCFLDAHHRCQLQLLAVESGHHPWFFKPLTCWIHPILITRPAADGRALITLPAPENDPQMSAGYPGFSSCTHCGRPDPSGIPAHQALEPELLQLGKISGRPLIDELRA